jgi:SAM-dependent methyltransferase
MEINQDISRIMHRISRKLYSLVAAKRNQILIAEVTRLLDTRGGHHPFDDEALFEKLRNKYPARDNYRYDSYHAWKRAAHRAMRLLEHMDLQPTGLSVLDVGCGDGMFGNVLSGYGYKTAMIDLLDWRDSRAKRTPFVQANLDHYLPFLSASFDLICSYNTFEHLRYPGLVFSELDRISKPGATLYLHFGPLYASPWGLHAHRTLHIPYVQFLFTPCLLDRKLKQYGIEDLGRKQDALQPLNQWRLNQFTELWDHVNFEVIYQVVGTDLTYLHLAKEYPQAFQGLNLAVEDLISNSIEVMLRKR